MHESTALNARERDGRSTGSDRTVRCPTRSVPHAGAMQVSQGWPGGVKRSVKYADVDANRRRVKNLDMTIVEITGGMLRAARSLTGLSQQELADRASISRPCLKAWEGSSDNVPNAKARALHRVVSGA